MKTSSKLYPDGQEWLYVESGIYFTYRKIFPARVFTLEFCLDHVRNVRVGIPLVASSLKQQYEPPSRINPKHAGLIVSEIMCHEGETLHRAKLLSSYKKMNSLQKCTHYNRAIQYENIYE